MRLPKLFRRNQATHEADRRNRIMLEKAARERDEARAELAWEQECHEEAGREAQHLRERAEAFSQEWTWRLQTEQQRDAFRAALEDIANHNSDEWPARHAAAALDRLEEVRRDL